MRIGVVGSMQMAENSYIKTELEAVRPIVIHRDLLKIA
jgi:hypothetical protein